MLNKILKFILNALYKFRKNNKNCAIKKILFIRFDSKIGDSVVESFFIRELKKLNLEVSIDVVVLEPYFKIVENNPHINKIYSIPFKKNKWIESFCLIAKLRKQKYDLVIDIPFKPTLKRIIYLYFVKAKKVMSVNIDGYDFINYKFFCERGEYHFSQLFVNALLLLGVQNINKNYELFISNEDKEYVDNFINKNNLNNKKLFVFNPNGSTITRSLNKENIYKILKHLQKYKEYSIILLDYKKEFDDFKNLANLFISNNIMQVAALIEKSNYVFTTDTGIVHISDVYLKPMTVLYSDVYKRGDKPRINYIVEWHSINSKTSMLRDTYNVNNISINNICNVLDKELNKYE